MTLEQFQRVKYGDILYYTFHDGETEKVRVTGKSNILGGRISAEVIRKGAGILDCDAPYASFEITKTI